MPKDDHIHLSGSVEKVHPGGQFSVSLENGNTVTARLCGKMRKNRIHVILGDKVDVALSPYDLSHGFITFRHKV